MNSNPTPARASRAIGLAALLTFLPGCGIHVSTLRLVDPSDPGQSAYGVVSKNSSLHTIVKTMRDRSEIPIVVDLDSRTGNRRRFTGSVTGDSWPEVFEKILLETGVQYSKSRQPVPVFEVPKQ